MASVKVYTNGTALKNPGGIGGWCAIVTYSGYVVCLEDALPSTTNNRAELTAVIEALSFLQNMGRTTDITIHSDSEYIVKGCNDWLHKWAQSNWKNGAVKNRDLWEKVLRFESSMQFSFVLVGSHGENHMNNRADSIARECAREYQRKARFRKD